MKHSHSAEIRHTTSFTNHICSEHVKGQGQWLVLEQSGSIGSSLVAFDEHLSNLSLLSLGKLRATFADAKCSAAVGVGTSPSRHGVGNLVDRSTILSLPGMPHTTRDATPARRRGGRSRKTTTTRSSKFDERKSMTGVCLSEIRAAGRGHVARAVGSSAARRRCAPQFTPSRVHGTSASVVVS